MSKIFLFVADPGFWIPGFLVVGCLLLRTRWQRWGRRALGATIGVLLLLSVLPVGTLMIRPLENRFPPVRDLAPPIDGVVVLGGAILQELTDDRGQPSLSDGAERMTSAVVLARRFPEAKIVFTGGSGDVFRPNLKEAGTARLFFKEMGLDLGRIVFESESRNTYENAVYTYELMHPAPNERWVLITSAHHMPRAVGVFRKAGWKPVPYPVDFTSLHDFYWIPALDLRGGLVAFSRGLREWMALAAYRMLGRTDEMIPGPATHTTR